MGRDVAEYDKEIMDLWRLAEKKTGAGLREIFWDGDQEAMTQTRYQQPALCVVGLGLWKHLSAKLRPGAVAGHSVGEFTALAAAEVMSVEATLELVSLRGRLMYEAGAQRAGGMAAVLKLGEEDVQNIVQEVCAQTEDTLCVANFNSPQQIVISGAQAAVELASEKVRDKKGRCKSLPVSGAFHSELMREPARELAQVMRRMNWHDPRIAVHLNVTGTAVTKAQDILDIMQKQMISPVCWSQIIFDQWEQGVRSWWELGPKGVLTRLMRHILKDMDEAWEAECLSTLQDAAQMRDRLE